MSEVKTNKITSLASNNDITLDPDGTGDVVVASGHKLGVGTTSPVSNLHVITSDFKAAQFEGPRPTLFFKETDGSADENYQIRVNGGDLLFQSQNDAQSSAVDRMTIDSSGKVGIGTNSPPDDLSVVASGANAQLSVDRSDGASGRTVLIHSSTGGQLQTTGSVPLIFGTADTERMRLTSDGRLLHNTTSSTLGGDVVFKATDNNALTIHNARGTSGFFSQIQFSNNAGGAAIGSINRVNDASVQYNTSSDARLKENIADITDAITRVKQLAPKRYSWVKEELDAADQDGFLAHEAQAVVPIAVSGTQDEVDDDGNPVYMQMDYSKLVPLLTGALKEAIAKIETLETEMTTLKARVTALEAGE